MRNIALNSIILRPLQKKLKICSAYDINSFLLLKLEMKRKILKYQPAGNIIEECKKGNPGAQNELYHKYYKMMYNTSLRIVNDHVEAEDIMQEAFISAFTNLQTFDGRVSVGAWLKRIVINKSIDYIKKVKLDVKSIDDNIRDYQDDDTTAEKTGQNVDIQQIKKAIQDLPDGYRIILSLYLIEGYDHEEIGGIMKIKPSTSRSQYTRAKKKLLDILNQSSHD